MKKQLLKELCLKELCLKQLATVALTASLLCGITRVTNAEPIEVFNDVDGGITTTYNLEDVGKVSLSEELGEWEIKDIEPQDPNNTIDLGEGFTIKFVTSKHTNIGHKKGMKGEYYFVHDDKDMVVKIVNNSNYPIVDARLKLEDNSKLKGNPLINCAGDARLTEKYGELIIEGNEGNTGWCVWNNDFNDGTQFPYKLVSYEVMIDTVKNDCKTLKLCMPVRAKTKGLLLKTKYLECIYVDIDLKAMTYTASELSEVPEYDTFFEGELAFDDTYNYLLKREQNKDMEVK